MHSFRSLNDFTFPIMPPSNTNNFNYFFRSNKNDEFPSFHRKHRTSFLLGIFDISWQPRIGQLQFSLIILLEHFPLDPSVSPNIYLKGLIQNRTLWITKLFKNSETFSSCYFLRQVSLSDILFLKLSYSVTNRCTNCKKKLPLHHFDKDRHGVMGLKNVCRTCFSSLSARTSN